MKSKTFIIGFLAVIALVVAFSIYLSVTVNDVDKSVAAVTSPDGRYKAVRVLLTRGGKTPYCFNSVSVYLAIYPDSFAESEKAYQVFAQPCATSADPAQAPALKWTANDALTVTYTPAPAGTDVSKLRRRLVDASQYVHVTYVKRN